MRSLFKTGLSIITFLLLSTILPAKENIKPLIETGKIDEALTIINGKLNKIYNSRVTDRRVPAGFISMMADQREIDLIKVYRKRKPGAFFIEDNRELAELHFYAGICYSKKKKHRRSTGHFFQSLRFRKKRGEDEASLFYELSKVYKDSGRIKAYRDALETAYTLAPIEYRYSLLLGKAYSITPEIKKALFHLERYVKNTDDKPDPQIFLTIAGLNESSGKYLETEKYYLEYLKTRPDDAYIHFALGNLAYKKTGNYRLAVHSLNTAILKLPEKEIFRKSKSHEFLGDIHFHDLYYERALKSYLSTIKYQNQVFEQIKQLENILKKTENKINKLKETLLSNKNYDDFEQFQYLQDKKGKIEFQLKKKNHEYKKLNPGRVRWYIAASLEKLNRLEESIPYYRECISFDYRSNSSRKNITKLKLKIKRGY